MPRWPGCGRRSAHWPCMRCSARRGRFRSVRSPHALMTAAVLLPLAAGNSGRYAALAAALAIMVGGLCLLGGLARLGILADLLSKPVLTGYMAGVAVIMNAGQLGKLTGVPVAGGEFLENLRSFSTQLGQIRWPTLVFALAVLAALLL